MRSGSKAVQILQTSVFPFCVIGGASEKVLRSSGLYPLPVIATREVSGSGPVG